MLRNDQPSDSGGISPTLFSDVNRRSCEKPIPRSPRLALKQGCCGCGFFAISFQTRRKIKKKLLIGPETK